MIASIVKSMIKPVAQIFQQKAERKLRKVEAKAAVERVMAEAAAKDSLVAGQIALVNAENQNNTWKDEYALLVITLPVVIGMVISVFEAFGWAPVGTVERLMTSMFTPIDLMPEFWQDTFKVGLLSALGVTVLKKIIQ